MDDSGRDHYALGRLVLDYLRALIWPLAVVVAVLVYQPQIEQILTEREVDLFGLRIGERLEQIDTNVSQEIEDIRGQLVALRTAPEAEKAAIAERLETQVRSLESNLGREFREIRSEAPPAAPSGERAAVPAPEPTPERQVEGVDAAQWEANGFRQLLDRDIGAALNSFTKAYRAWPDYHNVAEIRELLRDRREALSDPHGEAWPALYRTILTRYSWGMPVEAREAMRDMVGY